MKATTPKKKRAPRKQIEKPTKAGTKNSVGGKREGAGRKPGATTTKTREIADALVQSGEETPLEYMLRVMRQKDDDLLLMEKEGAIDTVERIKMELLRSERRDWAAEKAAPYIHPRLASIEAKIGVSLQEEWLEHLAD